MNGFLDNLEYLKIVYCEMKESFFEHLLCLALKLKRLCLIDSDVGKEWLQRIYQTLGYFEINSTSIISIAKFLARNTNIHKFGINATNLWKNVAAINNAQVKVKDLTIAFDITDIGVEKNVVFWQTFNSRWSNFCENLNFYYSGFHFNQDLVNEIAKLTVVNRLTVDEIAANEYVKLSGLMHLTDFSLPDSRHITDIEIVATKHQNLKFIHFGISSTSHLKFFMGRNSKLKRMQINWFVNEVGNIEDDTVLNLIALNTERSKLTDARKITLFVQESIYLATKRKKRDTYLDFIELKRTESLNDR